MMGNRFVAVRSFASTIFAATLAVSMIPAAALAVDGDAASAPGKDAAGSAGAGSSAAASNISAYGIEPGIGVVSADIDLKAQQDALVIAHDGLNYLIGSDGATFIGWSGQAPEGALVIPAEVPVSGASVPVVAVDLLAGQGGAPEAASEQATGLLSQIEALEVSEASRAAAAAQRVASAFQAPLVTSLDLPETIQAIAPAVSAAFPGAKAITVAEANPVYISSNGMLFARGEAGEPSSLLLCPESMEGNAVLPGSLANVPAYVFSRCTKLSAIHIPTGSSATSALVSQDGLLYERNVDASGAPDGTLTLVAVPAGIGASVTLAEDCTAIGEGAFWGASSVQTIVVRSVVGSIAAGSTFELPADAAAAAQDPAVKRALSSILCVDGIYYPSLPAFPQGVLDGIAIVAAFDQQEGAGEGNDAWGEAGASSFPEPSLPGEVLQPEDGASGFSFTLLDDRTLSVSWAGDDDAPSVVSIPEAGVIDGVSYTVSAIADKAFAGQAAIAAAVVPDTVASIGAGAFRGCSALKTIELGAGLQRIGAEALADTALASIVIPDSVSSIGSRALGGLSGTVVVAPGRIAELAGDALAASTGMSVYVPYDPEGGYSWSEGLPAAANRLFPYGVRLNPQALVMQAGQSANLYDNGGYLEVPGAVKASCSYNAKAVSVDFGTGEITAKQTGNFYVTVKLSLPIQVVPEDLKSIAQNTTRMGSAVNGATLEQASFVGSGAAAGAPRTVEASAASSSAGASATTMVAGAKRSARTVAATPSGAPDAEAAPQEGADGLVTEDLVLDEADTGGSVADRPGSSSSAAEDGSAGADAPASDGGADDADADADADDPAALRAKLKPISVVCPISFSFGTYDGEGDIDEYVSEMTFTNTSPTDTARLAAVVSRDLGASSLLMSRPGATKTMFTLLNDAQGDGDAVEIPFGYGEAGTIGADELGSSFDIAHGASATYRVKLRLTDGISLLPADGDYGKKSLIDVSFVFVGIDASEAEADRAVADGAAADEAEAASAGAGADEAAA